MIGKVISWNVHGINAKGKRLIICGCLSKWSPMVVCLQETKMEEYNDGVINSIWSVKDKGWQTIPAKGLAGKIVIPWKDDHVLCADIIKGECTLSCIFENHSGGFGWIFTGVYCRGNRTEKDILWEELENCRTKWGGNWIIGGDFNMTMQRNERSGSNFSVMEAKEFKERMDKVGVVDLPLSKR